MMRRREKILTIVGIVTSVMFISFATNALADQRPYAHYHYDPGTPVVPSSPNNGPYIYLSDEFELTVRLTLTDNSWKFSMPDFYVKFAGETEYVPSSDFNDDGKAKVELKVDRDEIGSTDTVEYQSYDGRYYNSHTFNTYDRNGVTVNFKIRP